MKMPGRPGSAGPLDVELKRYGTQLVKTGFVTQNTMDKITSLASFLPLFYVKNWCSASVLADAPIHNLELWNQFESMKNTATRTLNLFQLLFLKFANSVQEKLERHLWYVSERHVVFSLFNKKLSLMEKTEIWRKLKSCRHKDNEGTIVEGILKMPDLTSTTHLKDLIGADSHTLSKLLPAASNINLHPKTWSQNADFVAVKAMIENLPTINDAAERALALVTNIHFSPTAPKLHRTKKDQTTVHRSRRQKLKKHVQQQQHEHEQKFNPCHEQILKSFDPLQ